MLNLVTLLNAVYGRESCSNPVKIQMVQVQDTTISFKDDIGYMKDFMTDLTDNISTKYGPIDFGMVSFTDKPQVITGYGKNGGVWRDYAAITDYCYDRISPLSLEVSIDKIGTPEGGKDYIENQFDSLAASVIDPNMNWIQGDETEDGEIAIKLAILVTDAAAHRNSAVDLSDSKRNWYSEELFRGPCAYKDESCTSLYGDASSRTGVPLSLKGVIGHYNNFNMGNDMEMLTHMEYSGAPNQDLIEEYRFCCTQVYDQKWPNGYWTTCGNFTSYADCAAVSCKKCKAGSCDDFCADDPTFEADFMKTVDLPEINITPYTYGAERFAANGSPVDCSTMEYPDPFSQEYANQFKVNNVTPVFFLRLPGDKPKLLGNPQWPFAFTDYFLGAHVCPITGQRMAKYHLCYHNTSVRTENGITTKTNACENYDPAELQLDTFYADCWNEHYGEVVDALKSHGVDAFYSVVDSSVTGEVFLAQLEAVVSEVIENSPKCHETTVAPDEPTTTTTVPVVPTIPVVPTVPTDATTVPTDAPTVPTIPVVPTVPTVPTDAPTVPTIPVVPTVPTVPTDAPTVPTIPVVPTVPTEAGGPTAGPENESTSEGGSSSMGVIVGSAAGGIAAIGAAGALWGKGMIPGMNGSAPDVPMEDANIETDAMEREQITEVDANMFL